MSVPDIPHSDAASLVHPSYRDVQHAAAFLQPLVSRTPLFNSAPLDALAGAKLWLKAENTQRIGAFKARGAHYCVGQLSDEQRAAGVITYSSGNHAQAVALAARHHGIRADITMPEDTPASKVEAVRQLGAHITFAGTTSDHRHEAALKLQRKQGGTIIEPSDHPHIITGQGTAILELFEQLEAQGEPPLDALLLPVGGGGLLAGACLVAQRHGVPVYSVEPEGCDSMARSLANGRRLRVEPAASIADGLRTVRPGVWNFSIAQQHVTGALTVSEEDIGRTLVTLLWAARSLVEPSGAAALAAALNRKIPGTPKRIGIVLSGGNIGNTRLQGLLDRFQPYAWKR